jgi:hypothetical protein
MTDPIHKLTLAITASILAAASASAIEAPLSFFGTNMPPIDFHGFASQGFLASSDYNYLGNDTRNGSFQFTEAGLNASINPFPRTRITAQAFTYDIGNDVGKYDLVLDYAQAEYTFNDEFGIRAGRIRRPQGIYNAVQDVDMARTFVLLPQGVYDSRWRDFYVSLDGGEFFGALPLGKAGSLSYELFGGLDRCALDGGVANFLRSQFGPGGQVNAINSEPHAGAQLWWNTPLDGLRFGAAGGYKFDWKLDGTIQIPHGSIPVHIDDDISYFQGSVEYTWKAWTFQTEYYTYLPHPVDGDGSRADAWYAAASYRINKWVEAGVYYSEYYGDTTQRANSLDYQKDAALALRFDLRDWWILKVEGHYIHGTGLLEDDGANPSQDNRGWFMLALKTTVSF